MALSKNLYADLGAEPVEPEAQEAPAANDFSDLGAEPVEAPAGPAPEDFSDLGAQPVDASQSDMPRENQPDFFESLFQGFKQRKEAEDAAAQQAAAQPPPDMGVREFVPDTELKASPAEKKGFAGFLDSLKKFYRPDMTKQQMIDEMSREYSIDPKEVEDNFNELARKKAQSTGVFTQPTNEEFLNAVMVGTLPIAATIAGPLAVAKGLVAYTGVKEASERVILPAARAVIQKLQGDPVQYEVTKFREAFPDVGPTRDLADLSEFVIYGIGAKNAIKFMESPRMAGELAGLRYRILKALGVKQETGLVPLTDAQIKEAFGDQAWKYLSKEGLAKWKAEELGKRGAGTGERQTTTTGEGQPEVKLEPSKVAPAAEVKPGAVAEIPKGTPSGTALEPVAPEVVKELGAEPVQEPSPRKASPEENRPPIPKDITFTPDGKATVEGKELTMRELIEKYRPFYVSIAYDTTGAPAGAKVNTGALHDAELVADELETPREFHKIKSIKLAESREVEKASGADDGAEENGIEAEEGLNARDESKVNARKPRAEEPPPTEQKQVVDKELEKKSIDTFGRKFSELKTSEKKKVLKDLPKRDIDQATAYEIATKRRPEDIDIDTRRPLAGDKSGEYISDGRFMIIDEKIAKATRDKIWSKVETGLIKRYQNSSGMTFAEAKAAAQKDIAEERISLEPPNYSSIIPKKEGTPAKVVGAMTLDGESKVVVSDGKGRREIVDAGYLKMLAEHFPLTGLRLPAEQGKPIEIWKDGKLKALLMPMTQEKTIVGDLGRFEKTPTKKMPETFDEVEEYLRKKYPSGLTLYHQTSKAAAEKILKEGFNPDAPDAPVFFSVETYNKQRMTLGGNEVVLKIVLPPDQYGHIGADPGGYEGKSDEAQLADFIKKGVKGGEVTVLSEIVNEHIKDFVLEPVATQKEKVKAAVSEKPKSIKEVAAETGIVEPNIRRILGVGAKDGTFSRVDQGVYILNKDGQDVAYIYAGDAVETLPKLAKEGLKVDMVYLDIPYNTAAVRGGNRGVKYSLISTAQFKQVVSALNDIIRDENTPVYYMYSIAPTGLKQMLAYNNVLINAGFKPIAEGGWNKVNKDGSPATDMRGAVIRPEKILLLNKSGVFNEKDLERNLNFTLERPRGYQSEKPAAILRSLIMQGTKKGDTVLDPFAGSGVTPAEAVKAGRKAVAIEKEESVVKEKIVPRVKKAMKETGGAPSGTAFAAPPESAAKVTFSKLAPGEYEYKTSSGKGYISKTSRGWSVHQTEPFFNKETFETFAEAKASLTGKTASGTAFSEPFSEKASKGGWQPKVEEKWKEAGLDKFFGGMEYVKAVEMPELVKLARQLFGAPPAVVKKTGSALGRFIAARGHRDAMIKLAAKMFKDPELAAGVIAHEIGHGVDWLPDYTLNRGNLLGRIASLHNYMKEVMPDEPGGTGDLTDKDRARIRREAEKKVGKPPEVETELDPKAVLDIFNTVEGAEKNPAIAEYIKRLNTEEKKAIIKSAMEAARKGEKITINEVKKFNADYAANKEAVHKAYEDLIREEIKKRKLFSDEIMREELKALTTWWHPFDPALVPKSYLNYRYSGKELYAEFLSVLLNAPGKAKEMAPTFYRGFFNYLDSKPEVKQRFFEIQELLREPTKVLKNREEDTVKMFKKSRDTFANLLNEKMAARKSLRFLLKYHLSDRNVAVLDARNRAIKKSGPVNPEDDPKYLLEENNMIGSFVKSYLDEYNPILQDLLKEGLDFDRDFGQYLMLKRVIGDRAEYANPLGQTPETAKRQLDYMKERLGAERYDKLEGFVKRTREWFMEINKLLAEDVLSPEQAAKVLEPNDYAPFRVTKYLKTYASARFMKQVGTLNDIENPAASMVLKAVAMLRTYKRNAVEKKTGEFLLKNNEAEHAVVKTYDGQVHIKPKDDLDIIKWRSGGRWRAAYVDPYIADSFRYDDAGLLQSAGELFERILLNNVIFRPVYITFNVGFQSFNLVRDFTRAWKNTPGATLPKMLARTLRAVPPSVRRVKGEFDPLISQMEREGALNITMNDLIMGKDREDTEIHAILSKYDILHPPKKTHPILRPLAAILNGIKFAGDVIETIPKVAGFYNLENMNATERAYYLRNYIGTPNFKRRGKLYALYNSILLFSNIIKEGIRSDYEAAFKNPKTRAGFWWKTIKIGFIPKILMFLGAAGYFGKQIQENYEKQTEYDKTNYTTIPLGEDEKNQASYLRIPQDETTRLLSGIFWKFITRRDLQDIAAFTGGQIPSLSPMLTTMATWGEFLTGGNPRDGFRNQEILTRDEVLAGGAEALEPMIRWTLNQTGLVHMDLRDRLKDETLLERTLAYTPIVNRWVRLTDYGKTEELRRAMGEQKTAEAKGRLEDKDTIREGIRAGKSAGDLIRELRIPGPDRKDFLKKYNQEKARPTEDATARALRGAASNEQKLAVLNTLGDDYETTRDFRRAVVIYYKSKHISLNVLNEAVRRFNKKKREVEDESG